MKLFALDTLPRLNTTPLSSVRGEEATVIVEADDEHEQRNQFVLKPYQALRMTTADCFVLPPGIRIEANVVYEIAGSAWIVDLKRSLSIVDETATSLNKAHHYLFPLGDVYLEVV